MFKAIYLTAAVLIAFSAQANENKQLSDAQIRNVLLTINEGEITAGELAAKRAKSAEVKEFANAMVTEHKQNMEETKTVTKNSRIKARDSKLSKSLRKEAWSLNKELKKADAATFDKAYVDQQVLMHRNALSTLDDTLIPNAKDAAFKAHLEKTRSAVQAHLEHAQSLQSKM